MNRTVSLAVFVCAFFALIRLPVRSSLFPFPSMTPSKNLSLSNLRHYVLILLLDFVLNRSNIEGEKSNTASGGSQRLFC